MTATASPPDVKNRPPGTTPETGPRSAQIASQAISATVTRISDGRTASTPRRTYHIGDLPPHLGGRLIIDPACGDWIWTGPVDRDGYGKLGGRGVHRIVWEILEGPVPAGLVLDHREDWGCTTRACCWPAHLKPVTVRVNTLRGNSFSAINARKFECIHRHPFDLLNTYIRPDGARDCRQCIRRRTAEYKARKIAAQQQQFPMAALRAVRRRPRAARLHRRPLVPASRCPERTCRMAGTVPGLRGHPRLVDTGQGRPDRLELALRPALRPGRDREGAHGGGPLLHRHCPAGEKAAGEPGADPGASAGQVGAAERAADRMPSGARDEHEGNRAGAGHSAVDLLRRSPNSRTKAQVAISPKTRTRCKRK